MQRVHVISQSNITGKIKIKSHILREKETCLVKYNSPTLAVILKPMYRVIFGVNVSNEVDILTSEMLSY